MNQQAALVRGLVHPRLDQVTVTLLAQMRTGGRGAGANGTALLCMVEPAQERRLVLGLLTCIEGGFVLLARRVVSLPGCRRDASVAQPQEEDLRHLGHRFIQQLQAVAVEGLQYHSPWPIEPATGLETCLQVLLDAGELARYLGLDIQPWVAVMAAFGDIDDFIQRQYRQMLERWPGTFGISPVEPAADIQRLQLREGESAHWAFAALGESFGDIAGARQLIIMDYHQHTIAGALQIHFQIIGAQLPGQQIGGFGGFGGIVGSAAVGDHGRVRNTLGGSQGLAVAGRSQ